MLLADFLLGLHRNESHLQRWGFEMHKFPGALPQARMNLRRWRQAGRSGYRDLLRTPEIDTSDTQNPLRPKPDNPHDPL
jgi:hypothetical protein